MEKFLNSTKQNSLPTDKPVYECDLCKDTEFIFTNTNTVKPCECRQAKHFKRLYENSGISKAFRNKTFENFITTGKPKTIEKSKQVSQKYVKEFVGENSIALLGQVGSGKTHLCIAIANELLKRNVGVLYMQYREVITALKQAICDDETYQRELNKYKGAKLLYIDDLFKGMLKQGSVNDSEMRIMFEIINYRYLNNSPIMVSSEYGIEKLLSFDEAVGSRIIEMCKGYIVELEGMELNHRLVV